ncbi:SERTA domain containing 2 [Chamberlinius hualienensis]
MGFWLSWNVEDNVKMQVSADNAAAASRKSPCPDSKECPGLVRHGTKRKLEEETTEEVLKTKCIRRNSRVYSNTRERIYSASMTKLNRFRQSPEPPLRSSVLICNTIRTIEKEMRSEGLSPSPPPVAILASIETNETDKITLDPIPNTNSDCYPAATTSSPPYFGAPGNVVSAVENVSCRDNNCELGYEKRLTDLDSVSGRATPYPSTNNSNNNIDLIQNRSELWVPVVESSSSSSAASASVAASSSSSSLVSDRVNHLSSTNTISWSNVLCFPGQNELITTSSSVSEDVWPSNGAFFDPEVNGNGGNEPESGGPNTSPSSSSDSGISTASDEIFGDIDLSLYDFDVVPLSPPNSRAPSAEDLLQLRIIPPTGQSIQLAAPLSSSYVLPSNRHSRSFDGMSEEFDHVMHVMPTPP